MHIPERPKKLGDLNLMLRLEAYSNGKATWHASGEKLGEHEQTACRELHANLTALIEKCVHPLMDRITAREMQEFTMHDRGHGLKVAHLMWHIMKSDRRELLSPGDIALLVTSAHLHDLGMGLSQVEREVRLQPDSDLWDNVDPQSVYFKALENLTELARTNQVLKGEAIYQIQQAQEALLCIDTRERHATPARYNEILLSLAAWHEIDPINIPNIDTTLGFDGDSYKEKLVEICVSHNQNAHSLIDRDPSNIDQWRFPIQYPLGCCLVNTRLVAAALRLADILDFDRERTPPVLYHYLLPRSADPSENISVREWSKHLSISNWEIDDYKIIFRGRSPNAVIHHSIVEFCHVIENEIAQTYSVFADEEWPFSIRAKVETMIEAIGYRYVPYRFSLDEERIYELLMGQSIYHNRLDALRELVQNAVDACKLRDAIMLSNDRSIVPSKDHRIVIRYDESKGPEKPAALSVIDTGIGMDQYVIENYFLKVGRSYYKSSDFLRIRSALRRQNLDFNPISEFGIGFMAVFMLGDRVEVETAPWFPARNDAQRRVLKIDGLGRLIELRESQNLSPSHLPGTRVSIRLGSGPNRLDPPTWREVEYYLRQVCRNLDYPILLQQMTSSGNVETQLLPEGLCVPVPQHLANAAFHIEVDNPIEGLKGEIVLFHAGEAGAAEAALAAETPIRPVEQHSYAHRTWRESGVLLRGGFNVGPVPGLPEFVLTPNADARIELTKDPQHPRSLPITDLARSRIVKPNALANSIFKIWCRTLLDSIKDIEARPVGAPDVLTDLFAQARWLEEYNAFEVYRLARTCWRSKFRNPGKAGIAIADWESARGGALWVDDSYTRSLHFQIFELILPKVTELMVGRGGNYYLLPPSRKWKTELRKWHSFIADKLSWGVFAQFTGEIGNVLCDLGSKTRFLNSQYRHKLSNFSSEELTDLIGIIDKLATAKSAGEQANLPSSDLPLLERALDVAGDLLVERFHNRYRLNALVGRS